MHRSILSVIDAAQNIRARVARIGESRTVRLDVSLHEFDAQLLDLLDAVSAMASARALQKDRIGEEVLRNALSFALKALRDPELDKEAIHSQLTKEIESGTKLVRDLEEAGKRQRELFVLSLDDTLHKAGELRDRLREDESAHNRELSNIETILGGLGYLREMALDGDVDHDALIDSIRNFSNSLNDAKGLSRSSRQIATAWSQALLDMLSAPSNAEARALRAWNDLTVILLEELFQPAPKTPGLTDMPPPAPGR